MIISIRISCIAIKIFYKIFFKIKLEDKSSLLEIHKGAGSFYHAIKKKKEIHKGTLIYIFNVPHKKKLVTRLKTYSPESP